MFFKAENISKCFYVNGKKISVLDNTSLTIAEGEKIGLFGQSGSGKTTLGQIVAGLQRSDSGNIVINDQILSFPYPRPIRKKVQILFQQPEASFNPRRTLWESLREPYQLYKLPINRQILSQYLLDFGLYPEHLDRYPRELSGGELQRAALARILVLKPELIVLDEPTSMLDAISQSQMIHMLNKIYCEQTISYLFISHDLSLSKYFCDRIYWIDQGKIREENSYV